MYNIKQLSLLYTTILLIGFSSCKKDDRDKTTNDDNNFKNNYSVFLLIDEESIDNGIKPSEFSEADVNDQLAEIGLRSPLQYFQNNIGKTIDLYTGDVGDEGWFAPTAIPNSWIQTGPTMNGTRNYFTPGPGLGAKIPDNDREILLDKIPGVTPLRAEGLTMLIGKTVYAVVYDGDVAINYSPLLANLQGSNLGIVAFDVLSVTKRTDGSSGSLPKVSIRIRNVGEIEKLLLNLFSNPPTIQSSSEPFDITPSTNAPVATFVSAP